MSYSDWFFSENVHCSKVNTLQDMAECDIQNARGEWKQASCPLTVSTAVHWPHEWVMWCRGSCLSWPKVKEKALLSVSTESRDIFHNFKLTLLMRQEIFTKGVLSSLNKINETWKWASSCSHWQGGREAERTSSSAFINHTRHYTWERLHNPDIQIRYN